MLKHVDFCCGSGGFSLAFSGKVKTVFANDFSKASKKIFEKNFESFFQLADIHNIDAQDIPSFDILTAGFPCQPFSIAGNQNGFQDDRSQVFWKLVEIIDYHKPRYFILENVKNLISHDKGRTFDIIKKAIGEIGYFFKYQVLNTKIVTGIPQNRERIYIVAFNNEDECKRFAFPDNPQTLQSIQNFLDEVVPDKYYYSEKLKIWPLLKEQMTEEYCIYQYRRYYLRKSGQVCPTLTANMGTGGHNVPLIKDSHGIRKLTPRECFRLQGFSEEYLLDDSDSKLYSLAGNAITVPIAKMIIDKIIS
jgi:DNA (cytosine-5)-methyltransferase 1